MAIIPEDEFTGKIIPASSAYPFGQARNVTAAGDRTGTPFRAELVNDLFGFQQALLMEANITPTGDPDTALASQYLDAMKQIIATSTKILPSQVQGLMPYKTPVTISSADYSHFGSVMVNQSKIGVGYYHGNNHGQDDKWGICDVQTVSGAGYLTINGNYAAAGKVVLGAGAGDGTGATRFSITSTADDSTVTFTITKKYLGVETDITITGVDTGTVYSTTLEVGEEVTAVYADGACIGDISAGLYMLPSNISFKQCTNGNVTYGSEITVADGLTAQNLYHYSPSFGVMSSGKYICLYLEFNIKTFSTTGSAILGTTYNIIVKFSDDGEVWTDRQVIVLTNVSPTSTISLYGNIKTKQDGTMYVCIYSANDNWLIESTDGINWDGNLHINSSSPNYSETAYQFRDDKTCIAISRIDSASSAFIQWKNENYGNAGSWVNQGATSGLPVAGGYVSPALENVFINGIHYLVWAYMSRLASNSTGGGLHDTIMLQYIKWDDALAGKTWRTFHATLPAGTLPDRSGYPSLYANPVNNSLLITFGQEAGTGTKEASMKAVAVDIGEHFHNLVTNENGIDGYLMSYGGKKFNGTTDYMTGAVSGISSSGFWDGQWNISFDTRADLVDAEILFDSTGNTIKAQRMASGDFRLTAENSSGTLILDITTQTQPLLLAGYYTIQTSGSLADSTTACIVINNVSYPITFTVYTNDTIDYAGVANYAIGGSVSAGDLFDGNMYRFCFNTTAAVDYRIASVRGKFVDAENVPVFCGSRGEYCTGTIPKLFHAYDTYVGWVYNKGSATVTWTVNGTPAAVTNDLLGQYGEIKILAQSWLPNLSGTSTPGTPTYTTQLGKWKRIGDEVTIYGVNLLISAIGGMVGTIQIDNLPLPIATPSSNTEVTGNIYYGGTTVGFFIARVSTTGTVALLFYNNTSTASSPLIESEITSAYQIRGLRLTYITSAV